MGCGRGGSRVPKISDVNYTVIVCYKCLYINELHLLKVSTSLARRNSEEEAKTHNHIHSYFNIFVHILIIFYNIYNLYHDNK